jgi:hypothetical protein
MATITRQSTFTSYHERSTPKTSFWKRFITWADSQDKDYHFGWSGGIIALHGCVITPLTCLVIMATGGQFIFWAFVIAALAIAIIPNLAALTTKYTIPLFFLSIVIDVVLIIVSLMQGFNLEAAYR